MLRNRTWSKGKARIGGGCDRCDSLLPASYLTECYWSAGRAAIICDWQLDGLEYLRLNGPESMAMAGSESWLPVAMTVSRVWTCAHPCIVALASHGACGSKIQISCLQSINPHYNIGQSFASNLMLVVGLKVTQTLRLISYPGNLVQ